MPTFVVSELTARSAARPVGDVGDTPGHFYAHLILKPRAIRPWAFSWPTNPFNRPVRYYRPPSPAFADRLVYSHPGLPRVRGRAKLCQVHDRNRWRDGPPYPTRNVPAADRPSDGILPPCPAPAWPVPPSFFSPCCPAAGLSRATAGRLCERWQDCWRGDRCDATPVGYPVTDGGGLCDANPRCPVPAGAADLHGRAGRERGPFGAETLPQPGGAQTMPPWIPAPKIGVDEGKGKQFDLDPVSRPGGAGVVGPGLPVGNVK